MNLDKIRRVMPHRIRIFRYAKGWTQERLAEAANIHPTYISRIESGQKLPTLYVICAISDTLGIHTYELFVDDAKIHSHDYKKRKLMHIVNESSTDELDTYSILVDALHRRRKRYKK